MSNIIEAAAAQITKETSMEDVMLWFDLHRLQELYVSLIDSDRLEEWPELFTEDGVYEIVPRENADNRLPIGIMHCFGQPMMRDRIISLRQANVFEPHSYRHMTSGLEFSPVDRDSVEMQSSYVVVQTLTDGETHLYQAGRYFDRVVRTRDGWRYQLKRAIYDTSRVQTLLVTPV
jgi:anthranilate 1,2-dioxygenase small subunit